MKWKHLGEVSPQEVVKYQTPALSPMKNDIFSRKLSLQGLATSSKMGIKSDKSQRRQPRIFHVESECLLKL
jgi:hypothetical protein